MVVTGFLLIIFGVVGVVLVPMRSSSTQIGFDNILMAMLNLAVLLTTENYPDIMHDTLDVSHHNYWWVLYFAFFLFIGLLVVNNLVLAVIWDLYKETYAASALETRVNERKQLLQVFAILDWDKKEYVDTTTWCTFVMELMPDADEAQAMVMFDTLDLNGDGEMGILEFLKLHQLIALQKNNPLVTWKPGTRNGTMLYFEGVARDIVSHPWFENFSIGTVAVNTVLLMLREKNQSAGDYYPDGSINLDTVGDTLVTCFLIIFTCEIAIRYTAGGYRAVCGNLLDKADTFVVLASAVLTVVSLMIDSNGMFNWYSVQLFMVWRVVRIFHPLMRYPEYRALIETVLTTIPVISALGSMIVLEMYSFAIIGTELFYGALSNYGASRYENFNSFGQAMLALLQCLVINNWNGLLTELMTSVGKWSCLYLLSFLFWSVMISLTIVSAVFLEVYAFTHDQLLEDYSSPQRTHQLLDDLTEMADDAGTSIPLYDIQARSGGRTFEAMMQDQLEDFHRQELRALRDEWDRDGHGDCSLSEKRQQLLENVHATLKEEGLGQDPNESTRSSTANRWKSRSRAASTYSSVDISEHQLEEGGESPELWADRVYRQFAAEADHALAETSREVHVQQMRKVMYSEELKSPSAARARESRDRNDSVFSTASSRVDPRSPR